MRLPRAARKHHEELNSAYAFASSAHFSAVAMALVDGLVSNGFERQEAEDLIVRVAGYSDYFRDLGEALQDEIIARTEHQAF